MRFLLACWILLFALPLAAKPPVPLLWKVEKGAGTVYLLGSFHVLKPGDYPLDASLEAAYADAETVVFEVPPAAMMSGGAAASAIKLAKFEDGRTLRGVISPATAERLRAFLGSEAALAAADPFEPWYMSLNLAVMAIMQAGFDPTLGLDLHLMQRSGKDGKATEGLETIEDQLSTFDRTPLAEQDKMLADALKSLSELREQLNKLHADWRSGDANALESELAVKMRDETPTAYQLLLVERNQAWLPKIEAMLTASDDHLVVVGALHLVGEDGMVEQLRQRGYSVERVE